MDKNIFQDVIDAPVGSVPKYNPKPLISQQQENNKGLLSTLWEGFKQPMVGLGEDISFLFPEQKQARESIAKLRQMGGIEEANRLESELPATPTFEKVSGDIFGTALTGFSLMPGVGALGLISKGAKYGLLSGALRAGAIGAAYGGGFGMTSALSNKKNLTGIIEDTVKGSIIGAPFGVGGELAIRGIGALSGIGIKGAGAISASLAEKSNSYNIFRNWISSKETILSRNFGKIGEFLMQDITQRGRDARKQFANALTKFYDSGIIDIPGMPKQQLSAEERWMSKNSLDARLRGGQQEPEYLYQYAKPQLKTEPNVNVDKAFETSDIFRKELLVNAQEVKVAKPDLSSDNWMTQMVHNYKEYELPDSIRQKAMQAATPEEGLKLLMGEEGSTRWRALYGTVIRDEMMPMEKAIAILDDWTSFVKSGGRMKTDNKWLEYMVAKGYAGNIEQASGKMTKWMENSIIKEKQWTPRATSFDYERTFDFPFFERDPAIYLPHFAEDSILRINYARSFGAQDEKFEEMIGLVKNEQGEKSGQEFYKTVKDIMGLNNYSDTANAISQFWRTANVPKLSFAQILNLGQNLNFYLKTDLGSLWYGITKGMSQEGVRNLMESGAMNEIIMKKLYAQNFGGSKFADKWMRWTGFNWTERFNRAVAVNGTEVYAKGLAKDLIKNPKDGLTLWKLKELDINPEELLANGGKLNKQQLLRAGDIMATNTQFLSRTQDLPGFFSSPFGKVVMQFKNYSFQQMRFLKNTLVADLQHGNYTGFARKIFILGTVFPMTGEVVSDIRSLVTQSKRAKVTDFGSFTTRYLEDLANSGAWGLAIDFWTSAQYGKTLEALVGPTISGGVKLGEAALMPGEIDKRIERLVEESLRQTGLGSIPANLLFPSKSKTRESTLQTIDRLTK